MTKHATALEHIRQLAAQGQIGAAEIQCREILETSPQEPEGWGWLGLLLSARQQWATAESALRKAVELQPGHAPYWSYLSAALRERGQAVEAEQCARQALDLDGSQVSYWTSLAAALTSQLRFADAAEAYRQAVALNPADATLWQTLATSEHDAGNLAAAQSAFEQSLALAPSGTAAVGLAYLLSQRGEHERAKRLLTEFVARAPEVAIAWTVLAHIHMQAEELAAAEAACRRALKLAPEQAQARLVLIEALARKWRLTEAESEARRFVADEPKFPDGWKNLGLLLGLRAEHDEALAALQQALALKPDPIIHSRLLFSMQYVEGVEPESLLQAHKEWAIEYEPRNEPAVPPAVPWRKGQRKLRLGFISSSFSQHPIGFLALPLLEHLDKSLCSIVCYADGPPEDEYTARFRTACDQWRLIFGTAEEVLVKQVREDQVDVLLDLMGHTGNRLTAFARKLAPVQVSWLGYVGTTGLTAMDYVLADRFHAPGGDERFYTEKILRMPHGYACYGPPPAAPPVGPPPAARQGHVTFGCFNNPAKFSAGLLRAWAEILVRVPDSRLLIKYCSTKELEAQLLARFAAHGIRPDQVAVEGNSPLIETMAAYGRVDLALDTQPYSGGLTTCEALWMGVPVITFPGKTFAGRHSTSHLSNAGYSQFIAADVQEYIDLAVSWAGRLDELATIRAQLRDQMRSSPLCDAPQFAKDFLALIQNAVADTLRD